MLLHSAGDPSAPMLRDSRIEIRGARAPRGVPRAWLARSRALMARVHAAPQREIAGVGRGRAQEVMPSWLRPQDDSADAGGPR